MIWFGSVVQCRAERELGLVGSWGNEGAKGMVTMEGAVLFWRGEVEGGLEM